MVEVKHFPSIDFSELQLRKEDIREMETGSGLPWERGLQMALSISRWWGTIQTTAGEVLFIWGLAEMPNNTKVGCPWAIADVRFWGHVAECQKASQEVFQWMLKKFPVLMNMVDSRNLIHIKWLEKMGCRVQRDKQVELQGVPFYTFTLTRKDLKCVSQ